MRNEFEVVKVLYWYLYYYVDLIVSDFVVIVKVGLFKRVRNIV